MRRVLLLALVAALTPAATRAAPTVAVELHLKRVNPEAAIEQEFLDRATPGSPKYLQHLSVAQLAKLVRPRVGALSAVKNFITGTTGAKAVGEFVTGDVVTAKVELGTPLADALGLVAEHPESDLWVPVELSKHVARVALGARPGPPNIVQMGRVRPDHTMMSAPLGFTNTSEISMSSFAGESEEVNPLKLFARYKVPNAPVAVDNITQAVAEFQPMGFSQGAMDHFNKYYDLPATQIKVHGANPRYDPSFGFDWMNSIGQINVEYAAAMAQNATTWWMSNSGYSSWAQVCDTILSLDPMPAVVSIGAATAEFDYTPNSSQTLGTTFSYSWSHNITLPLRPIPQLPAALQAAEDGFRKVALAGVSVIVASTDNGPGKWNPWDGFMRQCGNRFGPTYPSTSQYVTSVGSTFAMNETAEEVGVASNGGGFSEFFPQPSWQKAAVDGYLDANISGMPPLTMYNRTGRAYPDVAILSENVAVAGQFTVTFSRDTKQGYLFDLLGGTAVGTPVFAGIVTRLVAERYAVGKGNLGCLTPTLYALGRVGHDVQEGRSNNFCWPAGDHTFKSGEPYGYPTAPGWDPVTGLGTPDYEFLKSKLV